MEKLRPLSIILLNFHFFWVSSEAGMLYPRETESRSIQELNGMWDFLPDRSIGRNDSLEQMWWTKPLSQVS